MFSTSDFKKGLRLEIDGQPWTIVSLTTQSPSARGQATLVKVRLKNALTGQVSDRSIKAGEKFKAPDLELRPAQYLYATPDGDDTVHHFMDQASYEQFELRADEIGDDAEWLGEGLEVRALVYNERVCGIELPQFVEVTLDYVEPGTRGDTASGAVTTVAMTASGRRLQVPLYIQSGDVVRVDPATGQFKDRVGGR